MDNKMRHITNNILIICISVILAVSCTGTSDADYDEKKTDNNNLPDAIETFKVNTSRDFIAPDYGATTPAKGETRIDPTTGVKITRLTNANELNGTPDALIVYSRYSPENSDGTLFLAFGANSTSSWVIERVSGKVVTELKHNSSTQIGEVHEVRWDMSGNNPNRIYYRNSMSFYKIDDVRNQEATRELIKDFSLNSAIPAIATRIYNDVEGDSSNDSDHWAWMAAHYDGTTFIVDAIIHYQISTDTTDVFTPADLANTPLDAYSGALVFPRRPNMVEVSPLGKGIVIHFGRCWNNSTPTRCPTDIGTWFDGPHLWPLDFDHIKSAPIKISIDESHSGWSFDANGNEYFVSQNNRTDMLDAVKVTGTASGYSNRIEVARHDDFGYSNGFHYGKMPASLPDWVFINTYSNISHAKHLSDWGADQFIMIQMKPETQNPIILRIGSNYNLYDGNYRDEAPAAVNMAGNRIYVSINWGGNLGHREVFVFELPTDWNDIVLSSTP